MNQVARAIAYQACFEAFYEVTGLSKTVFIDKSIEKIEQGDMPHPTNIFAWKIVELLGTET
jgi:hypothetical protein